MQGNRAAYGGSEMKRLRMQKSWFALLAILFLFAACKGDSPTAPPPGGGVPPGGVTPPSGVSLTLAASNTSPLVDSTVLVTATVAQNGAAVPNGTAVEFTTTAGSFDGGGTSIIKTTTNGVATATLTNSTAGLVRVTAVVNNVAKNVDVTFRVQDGQGGTGVPTIVSVTPSIGIPGGGQTIRITGTNFKAPVRVLFDIGKANPVEAFVVAVTDTTIDVITPGVDLGSGQELAADVIVITEAGATTEQRVERAGGFVFRNDKLTPIVSTATPNSGPVTGGTIVTIFGEGFQAPVQVLFGTAEARVINVTYNEIKVESPAGRDTAPDGSGTVTGPVDITVRNISSNTSVVSTGAYFYKAAMQITAVGPTEGPAFGGTRVTIEGIGFLSPVAVTIGGVAAQPISVSGTKVIALTSAPLLAGCSNISGPVSVTNIANGDTATGGNFTYIVPKPTIINVSPTPVVAGNTVTITVANAQPGVNRIKLGDRTVFPTSATIDANFVGNFVVAVPTNFEFPTEACDISGVSGVRNAPITLDVTYLNVDTGCTDTVADALTVNPTDTACRVAPIATTSNPPGACAAIPGTVTVGNTAQTQISVSNAAPNGAQSLFVTSATVAAPGISVTPGSAGPIAPGAAFPFTVTVQPTAAGVFTANVTFGTNDPAHASVVGCVSGTAVAAP